MDKIDAAVKMLESQGHVVEMKVDGKTWFEIDRRMRASAEEMKNLADGVCSLSELEELFINRRIETTSAEELAEGISNEWAMYSQAGHSKDLTSDFSDFKDLAEKAFEFRNATQYLDNQRSSFELIAEHTGKPVSDTSLEQASSRESVAREAFLNAYKAYLNKQRISRAAKAG